MTTLTMDEVSAVVEKTKDAFSVRRVYGDAITQDGITIIPAARIASGAGAGGGDGPGETATPGHARSSGSGMGMGFGGASRPVGAFVVKNGEATWVSAVDRNLLAVLVTVVLSMLLLTVNRMVRSIRRSP
jgi:uncharacterized spore protein YtfJ